MVSLLEGGADQSSKLLLTLVAAMFSAPIALLVWWRYRVLQARARTLGKTVPGADPRTHPYDSGPVSF